MPFLNLAAALKLTGDIIPPGAKKPADIPVCGLRTDVAEIRPIVVTQIEADTYADFPPIRESGRIDPQNHPLLREIQEIAWRKGVDGYFTCRESGLPSATERYKAFIYRTHSDATSAALLRVVGDQAKTMQQQADTIQKQREMIAESQWDKWIRSLFYLTGILSTIYLMVATTFIFIYRAGVYDASVGQNGWVRDEKTLMGKLIGWVIRFSGYRQRSTLPGSQRDIESTHPPLSDD